MSDRAWSGRTARVASTAALALLSSTGLGAQALPGEVSPEARAELAALARRTDSARVAFERASDEYRRIARSADATIDTSFFEAGGIRIRVMPPVLTGAEEAQIRMGIERALTTLRERFGANVDALVDTTPWTVYGGRGRMSRFGSVTMLSVGYDPRSPMRETFRRPVTAGSVEDFVLRQAGKNVARVAPSLRPLAGGFASFASEEGPWRIAARELALSYSSPARRCHTGSIPDCRRALSLPAPEDRLATWFDEKDHRGVATASRVDIALNDSARLRTWGRCERGDDTACTALVQSLRVRDPFTQNLRGTFVAHALEQGPAGMLDRLRADTSIATVESIARAAGMDADTLVASWRQRLIDTFDRGRPPAVPVVLSTAAWGALLAFAATRRRPS